MVRGTVAFLVLGATMAVTQTTESERDAAVALAKKHLSGTLGARADAIELDKAEAVEWSDASLGCPEKGMMYAQMITPGHKVLLKSGGKSYAVHVGAGRAVVCDRSGKAGPKPPRQRE